MEPRPCFACGGDIPAGVLTMLIINTVTKPSPRRPGRVCQCETPLLRVERDQMPSMSSV
jgi:hypothetical protein